MTWQSQKRATFWLTVVYGANVFFTGLALGSMLGSSDSVIGVSLTGWVFTAILVLCRSCWLGDTSQ
ncbi:MAG: hypothetical protein ABEI52_10150, partial [Halobacteriaceae archaeon]